MPSDRGPKQPLIARMAISIHPIRRYAIVDETMLREGSALLPAWTTAQRTAAPVASTGRVTPFTATVRERRKSMGKATPVTAEKVG
jgi:hypothetical protein